MPTLLEQRANAMYRFEHGCCSAVGIDSAVDPRVAMVADDDPVFGVVGAFHFANHVPDNASLVVLVGDEMDFYAVGANVIAEGQRALPTLRRTAAFQGLQNGCGIVVADGDGDNVRLVAVGWDARRIRQVEC